MLGEVDSIEEEQVVKATGRIQTVPVGDALLGRVVDALGEPHRRQGPDRPTETRRMEVQAPGIMRPPAGHEPLQTGIKAIDAMTPIGRGQRELIIGDRKTGKTAVAIDTIINQRGLGAAIAVVHLRRRSARRTPRSRRPSAPLAEHGAMEYTIVVVASAGDPAPFKYLAPYAGCAMGQHWMENGEHALSSTTTCPSRPRRTARCRCCCAARRAARRTPATSSTCTAGCSSAAPSCPTRSAAGR